MLFIGNLFLLILLIVLGSLSSLLILRKTENRKRDVFNRASLTSALYIGNPILITAIAFVCMYAYIALANEKFSLYESYEYVRGFFLDKLWMQGQLLPVYGSLFLTTVIVYIITIVYARMNKDLIGSEGSEGNEDTENTEEDIEEVEEDEEGEEGVTMKSSASSFSKYYLLLLFTLSIYTIAITTLPLLETNKLHKLQFATATSLMVSIMIGMIIVSKHVFLSPILVALAVVAWIMMQ